MFTIIIIVRTKIQFEPLKFERRDNKNEITSLRQRFGYRSNSERLYFSNRPLSNIEFEFVERIVVLLASTDIFGETRRFPSYQ